MADNGTEVPSCFQIKKPNHFDKMTKALESMRMEESLCDISICCCGQVVKAHRVILAANSSFFREILSSVDCQNQYPIIFVTGVEFNDLQLILNFIYNGEMTISSLEELPSLVKCAEVLGINGLAQLDPDNPPINLSFQDALDVEEKSRTSSPSGSAGGPAKKGRKRKKCQAKTEPNDVGSDCENQAKKNQIEENFCDESEELETDSKGTDDKLAKSKLRSWSQQIAYKANHKDNEESQLLSESEVQSQRADEERTPSQSSDGNTSQTKKDNWRHSRARRPPLKYSEFTLPKGIQDGSMKASDNENDEQSPGVRPPTPRLTRGRSRVHSSDDPKGISTNEPSDVLSISIETSDTLATTTPNTRSRRQTHSPSEGKLEISASVSDKSSVKTEEEALAQGSSGPIAPNTRIKTPVKSQNQLKPSAITAAIGGIGAVGAPLSSSALLKWRPRDPETATSKFTSRQQSRLSLTNNEEELNYQYESLPTEGPPVYRCNICLKSFRSKQNITDHIMNVHNQSEHPTVHCCPMCNRSFKWKTSLNTHMNNIHPHSRPAPQRKFIKKSLP